MNCCFVWRIKMKQFSLKTLEKKAFRSFFKNGIYDVFLGLILLSLGLPFILNEFGLIDYKTIMIPLLISLILFAI